LITVDANIYISALEFGGTPLRLLRAAVDGDVQIAISQPILDEVLRVLRDKFRRSDARLLEIETWIRSFTHLVEPAQRLAVIAEDPDDDRILECAVASGSVEVVSGDKDLLRLGSFQGIRIVSARNLLDRIE
jgi:uncharacterized protein